MTGLTNDQRINRECLRQKSILQRMIDFDSRVKREKRYLATLLKKSEARISALSQARRMEG